MRKLIPTPRRAGQIDMTQMIAEAGSTTTTEAVDYLLNRFVRIPVSSDTRTALIAVLSEELGTTEIDRAKSYMEDPLRIVSHLIMSTPEYQIN